MKQWKGTQWFGYKKFPKTNLHLYTHKSGHQKIVSCLCWTRIVMVDELFLPQKGPFKPLRYCKRCLVIEEKLDE